MSELYRKIEYISTDRNAPPLQFYPQCRKCYFFGHIRKIVPIKIYRLFLKIMSIFDIIKTNKGVVCTMCGGVNILVFMIWLYLK